MLAVARIVYFTGLVVGLVIFADKLPEIGSQVAVWLEDLPFLPDEWFQGWSNFALAAVGAVTATLAALLGLGRPRPASIGRRSARSAGILWRQAWLAGRARCLGVDGPGDRDASGRDGPARPGARPDPGRPLVVWRFLGRTDPDVVDSPDPRDRSFRLGPSAVEHRPCDELDRDLAVPLSGRDVDLDHGLVLLRLDSLIALRSAPSR